MIPEALPSRPLVVSWDVLSRGADGCSIGVNIYSNVASWSDLTRGTASDASILAGIPATAWPVARGPDARNTGCALRAVPPTSAAHGVALVLGLTLLLRARTTTRGCRAWKRASS